MTTTVINTLLVLGILLFMSGTFKEVTSNDPKFYNIKYIILGLILIGSSLTVYLLTL